VGKQVKTRTPKWIVIGTGFLGLIAAVLVVVTRVYEIQKARAEASRAQVDADTNKGSYNNGKNNVLVEDTHNVVHIGDNVTHVHPITTVKETTVRETTVVKEVPGPVSPERAHKPATDEERLQGRWECFAEQAGGKDYPAEEMAGMKKTMRVKGDSLSIRRFYKGAYGEYRGTFSLRSEGGRKLFDFTGTNPGGGQIQLLGVYALEGDEFKVCHRVQEKGDPRLDRADRFTTWPNSARVFGQFRRVGD
jgi:uncharacterized protein (TIGR03067 family)